MKYSETIASQCRYGEIAARIFRYAEIIWEYSLDDYQGYANVLGKTLDGKFIHYEWTYGSCSGCDEWEARNLTDDEIEQEMRRELAVMDTTEQLKNYVLSIAATSIRGAPLRDAVMAYLSKQP